MDNRFSDANVYGDVAYKEIIWRITHGIEKDQFVKFVEILLNLDQQIQLVKRSKDMKIKCRYVLSTFNMVKTMNEKYDCSTNLLLPENKKKAIENLTNESFEMRKKTMIERYEIKAGNHNHI